MAHIDIIGLGPGDPGLITLKTLELLENSAPNYFRTAIHPTLDFINKRKISYSSFDQFYESEANFECVYQKIAATLIKQSQKEGEIVYAVPGNPLFGEDTVVLLIDEAKKKGLSYTLHSGVSFVDVTMNALEKDPVDGLNIDDAFSFSALSLDRQKATLITQVYNQHRASELKLELMKVVDPEVEVVLLINAGIPKEELIKSIQLFELDRVAEINHLTTLYIPAEKNTYLGLVGTLEIMKKLRNGCPWDRSQDHQSLKPYLIEESYEVLEAIDCGDDENLCEELGDVLFQIVFHATLGQELGHFDMAEVLKGINEKMIRRHPHVFTKQANINESQVERNWEAIKRKEKGLGEVHQIDEISTQMKNIPRSLPALMAAKKVQKKAAAVGFDWTSPKEASFKLEEEVKETMEAISENKVENIEEELGDLLFSVVNVARLYGFSSETLLRQATNKFIARFGKMEWLVNKAEKTISECNFEELNQHWEQAKAMINEESC